MYMAEKLETFRKKVSFPDFISGFLRRRVWPPGSGDQLCAGILDPSLLLVVDPPGENRQQKLPRL